MAKLMVLCCALGGCASAVAPPQSGVSPVVASAERSNGAPAAKPSAVATPAVLRQGPERFGGPSAASDDTHTAPSRPRFSVGKPIAIITTRVGRDDSAGDSAPPMQCEVRILRHKPSGSTREVATLKADAAPDQREDLMSLLKRKACEAGANAVLIKSISQRRVEGVQVDHVEAVALVLGTPKPPVDPSPVPKTITVTPEGRAVPKTITVDPSAAP
jgi:hypothetical protein